MEYFIISLISDNNESNVFMGREEVDKGLKEARVIYSW
jgi:hypothetical protein